MQGALRWTNLRDQMVWLGKCLQVPLQGGLDAKVVRRLLSERWAQGGSWEVRRVHRNGLLAVGSCAEGVMALAEARVLACGGSILCVQAWTLESGTYPTPGKIAL